MVSPGSHGVVVATFFPVVDVGGFKNLTMLAKYLPSRSLTAKAPENLPSQKGKK